MLETVTEPEDEIKHIFTCEQLDEALINRLPREREIHFVSCYLFSSNGNANYDLPLRSCSVHLIGLRGDREGNTTAGSPREEGGSD